MSSNNRPITEQVLDFCGEADIENKVMTIAEHMDFSEEETQKLVDYYQDHMIQLYTMSLEYSLKKSDNEFSDEEKGYIEEEFSKQLHFWWLEIQSEWIRLNNLSNFKSGIMGSADKMLQARASVCSQFLEPVARYLDTEMIESSMDYLLTLVKRSQLE